MFYVRDLKDTIKRLLPSDCKIEVNADYNVDRMFSVTILYPEILVTNEEDDEVVIEGLVCRIKGDIRIIDDIECVQNIRKLEAFNLYPTEDMIKYGYCHSHVNSLTMHNVCLGSTSLADLSARLSNTYASDVTEDDIIAYFSLLDMLFHTESLEGGPYKYINEIGNTFISDDAYLDEDDFLSFLDDYPEMNDRMGDFAVYDMTNDEDQNLIHNIEKLSSLYKRTKSDRTKAVLDTFRDVLFNFLFEEARDILEPRTSNDSFMLSGRESSYYQANIHVSPVKYAKIHKLFMLLITHDTSDIKELINKIDHALNDFDYVTSNYYTNMIIEGVSVYIHDLDDISMSLIEPENMYYLSEYASNNDNHDYEHIRDYVSNLSFYIENKKYEGKPEEITNNEETNYDPWDGAQRSFSYQGLYTIATKLFQKITINTEESDQINRNSLNKLVSSGY
jgi:hypothetical protein